MTTAHRDGTKKAGTKYNRRDDGQTWTSWVRVPGDFAHAARRKKWLKAWSPMPYGAAHCGIKMANLSLVAVLNSITHPRGLDNAHGLA